jgi:hypothetical protein
MARNTAGMTPDELAAVARPLNRGSGEIERVNRIYRTQLALKDGQAMDTLATGYANLASDLRERIAGLKDKVEAARAAGTTVTPDWLYRQERYKDLLLQTHQGLVELGGTTRDLLDEQSKYFVDKAEDYVSKASRAQLARTAPSEEALASVMSRFNSLPEEQIKGLLGNLQPGSPLNKLLFDGVPSATVSAVRSSLLETVGLGLGTAQGGRALEDALGLGLSRSMTIVRTETHRVQRDATLLSYKANSDIVSGWEWRCARTAETCAICWALDGTVSDIEEAFDTHINCRCTSVPKTRSWEELGFEGLPEIPDAGSGPSIFEGLSDKDKERILGGSKFAAYQRGDITLKDMVGKSFSKEWGGARHEVSLAQAYANAGKTMPVEVRTPSTGAVPKPAAIPAHEQAIRDMEAKDAEVRAIIDNRAAQIDKYDEDLLRLTSMDPGAMTKEEFAAWVKEASDIEDKKWVLIDANRDARLNITAEVRSILHVDDPISVKVSYGTVTDPEVLARWDGGVKEFERLISSTAHPDLVDMDVTFRQLPDGGRAYHLESGPKGRAGTSEVFVTQRERRGVVVHELGHAAEHQDPTILEQSLAWRDGRTAGEQAKWLGPGYRQNEVTRADNFANPYIGKDYGRRATEVLSMGLEFFIEDPLYLAKTDPDMFKYIYNVVRGIK